MTDTNELDAWAIYLHDPKIGEKRCHGVYLHAVDASADAVALQNVEQFPTVEPFAIRTGTVYTSREPATEAAATDFDTPIHVAGEVR